MTENQGNPENDDVIAKFLQTLTGTEKKDLLKHIIRAGGRLGKPGNPFNSEKWALQILPDIQAMMADPSIALFYAKEDYPKWNQETLRLYVTNAVKYIVDNYDNDNPARPYAKWREKVEIQRLKDGSGVRIVWTDEASVYKLAARRVNMKDLTDEDRTKGEDKINWKVEMWNFIDAAQSPGDKWEKTGLDLSKEEQEEIKTIFEPDDYPFGLIKLTNDSISIRKLK